jgi:drug/metabolite transporter (DMT)-like permease
VVLVPIGAAVFLRQRIEPPAIFGVVLATIGLALLSLNATMTVNRGDVLTLFCAIAFAPTFCWSAYYAPHFLTVDAGRRPDSGGGGGEHAAGAAHLAGWWAAADHGNVVLAVLISGLLGTAFAFTVQSAAQRFTSATHTALIFSLEPVAAGVSSYILIGEVLTRRALLGCALIFAGT